MTGVAAVDRMTRELKAAIDSGRIAGAQKERAARLLARLDAPVSVVATGLPGCGKSSVINALLGQVVIPEGIDLPVIECVGSRIPRTHFVHADGTADRTDGLALRGAVPDDVALVRLELPVPALNGMSLTEIRLAGSFCEQRAAVELAVDRADIVLWCSEAFTEAERALWRDVPDRIKDHALLVLTKADRLLMRGALDAKIAALQDIVAEEFYGLFPLATLQALAAREGGAEEGEALWKASGGKALAAAIGRQVALGRTADADNALVFLSRHGAATCAAPDSDERPVEPSPAPAPEGGVGVGNSETLARAMKLLAEGVDEMARDLPEDAAAAREFVLDRCLRTATGLSEILMQAPRGDPLIEALAGDAGEGVDMIVLMQLEGTDSAAEDALSALLQMRKALVESGAESVAVD